VGGGVRDDEVEEELEWRDALFALDLPNRPSRPWPLSPPTHGAFEDAVPASVAGHSSEWNLHRDILLRVLRLHILSSVGPKRPARCTLAHAWNGIAAGQSWIAHDRSVQGCASGSRGQEGP
jgi:hypothetical protein